MTRLEILTKKIINFFWFILFLYGFCMIIANEFVWDKEDNPILLTHVVVFMGLFLSSLFVLPAHKTNETSVQKSMLISWMIIPFFCSSLSVVLGRSTFDIDYGGPWIVHFREATSIYSIPQYYRFSDFLYHFLYPIGYLCLIRINFPELKNYFHQVPHRYLRFLIFMPLSMFLIWNVYILIYGSSFSEIYKVSHFVIIYIITGSLVIATLVGISFYRYFKMQEKYEKNIIKYTKSLCILGNILGIFLSISVYNYKHLLNNVLFLSFFITTLFFITEKITFFKKHFFFYLRMILSINIFMFFIYELCLWSSGGTENLAVSFFKEPSVSFFRIHAIVKTVFYFSNIILLYIYFIFLSFQHKKTLEETQGVFVKTLLYIVFTFSILFYAGIFTIYDILNTTKDSFYFLGAFLFSVLLIFIPYKRNT